MKAVNLTLCSCNKCLEKNLWKPYTSLEELISKKIRQEIPKAKLFFKDIRMPGVPKEKKESEVIAKVKDKEHVVKVIIKLVKCEFCSKEGTDYYEAILQVRSLNSEILEKGVELLKRRVENLRNKGVFINKVERVADGFDLYLTNKRVAQALGKELWETYGGVFKASPHLFTRNKQSSKNMYRLNVMARLADFKTSDIILNDDKVFRVEKTGAKIKLFDLEKNCFVTLDYPSMHYHVLKVHSTYVSRTQPYLEVINPFDFQSSLVRNKPEQKFELGQEVKVVVHKGIYVVE
jgi:NMD protein affecting ribosome stability and mRNA decay